METVVFTIDGGGSSTTRRQVKILEGVKPDAIGMYAFVGANAKRAPYENKAPVGTLLVERQDVIGQGTSWRLGRVDPDTNKGVDWSPGTPHREFPAFLKTAVKALGNTADWSGWSPDDAEIEAEISLADLISGYFRRHHVDAPAGADRELAREIRQHLVDSGELHPTV